MISRACVVCSGVVRYGWAPALRCADSLQHLRPERGHHAPVLRHAVLVELVEIVVQRIIAACGTRCAPRGGRRRCPAGTGPGRPCRCGGTTRRRARRAAVQMLTMPVATFNVVVVSRIGSTQSQFGRRGTADPHGAIAQGLDVFRLFRGDAASERSVAAQIRNVCISHDSSNPSCRDRYSATSKDWRPARPGDSARLTRCVGSVVGAPWWVRWIVLAAVIRGFHGCDLDVRRPECRQCIRLAVADRGPWSVSVCVVAAPILVIQQPAQRAYTAALAASARRSGHKP